MPFMKSCPQINKLLLLFILETLFCFVCLPHFFSAGGDNNTVSATSSPSTSQTVGEPPPPPPDVAQNDLMMRLGLLLGDKGSPGSPSSPANPVVVSPAPPPVAPPPVEEGFTSASSLTSSEAAPERTIYDTSPLPITNGM